MDYLSGLLLSLVMPLLWVQTFGSGIELKAVLLKKVDLFSVGGIGKSKV